jgi:GT2 family glycosyltransferase
MITRRSNQASVPHENGSGEERPRCSVVIPVHNKAALTQQCLDSVFAVLPQTTFEIVVVDDASSDSTPEMLASLRDRVRTVRLERNVGFATACNTGAAAARASDFVVFLNNDTIACEGWLDALVGYADGHLDTAVVGSKLLYPDGTIQHAGVAFSLAGDPLHIYVGCPGECAAVNTSRQFQAVTAACLLIRRDVFELSGGFDTDYLNDLEDVDLCLRLGELGFKVHYCHESTLYHLESVSRGKTSGPGRSAHIYRERWGAKVRHDELDYYLADGFMGVVRLPPDGSGTRTGWGGADADVLQTRLRQTQELLRAGIRFRAHLGASPADAVGSTARVAQLVPLQARKRMGAVLGRLREDLTGALSGVGNQAVADPTPSLHHGSPPIGRYEAVQADVRATVERRTEAGSAVLVVSKGDEALVQFAEREGWHFPRAADGRYAGYHPADGQEAVAHMERLRAQGAGFIVFPDTSSWWLDYYHDFARHLESRYAVLERTAGCVVFDLRVERPSASLVLAGGGRGAP